MRSSEIRSMVPDWKAELRRRPWWVVATTTKRPMRLVAVSAKGITCYLDGCGNMLLPAHKIRAITRNRPDETSKAETAKTGRASLGVVQLPE